MKSFFISLLVFFLPHFLLAQLSVTTLISDNMVLQRHAEVIVNGTANSNRKVFVKTGWTKKKYCVKADNTGKWQVVIPTYEAGGPYTISVTSEKENVLVRNILLGDVWLCSGQSNMEMPMKGFFNQPVFGSNDAILNAVNKRIRLFTVNKISSLTPLDVCKGEWLEADHESVRDFSAIGYFFAREINKNLDIPIGIINSSWGGSRIEAWMSHEALSVFSEQYQRASNTNLDANKKACHLYNGMINPLKDFRFKGVLWYQGESNRLEPSIHPLLLKSMVDDWRRNFGGDELPFYMVQIAPYKYLGSTLFELGKFVEQQIRATHLIPNSGIVSTLDTGEENCIHPAQKEVVAKRLAYLALVKTYNRQGIAFQSPVYKNHLVVDSAIHVFFEHVPNGYFDFGKPISSFEVAGEDKVFYPANARIEKNYIVVNSLQVSRPVAVRYAFRNFSAGKGFLYNAEGLPVFPFRTDDWNEEE